MKLSISAIALTALVTLGEARHCQNLTIPLEVSARQGKYNLAPPADNIAVTNFILDLSRQGHNYSNEALTGVSGDSSHPQTTVLIIRSTKPCPASTTYRQLSATQIRAPVRLSRF